MPTWMNREEPHPFGSTGGTGQVQALRFEENVRENQRHLSITGFVVKVPLGAALGCSPYKLRNRERRANALTVSERDARGSEARFDPPCGNGEE